MDDNPCRSNREQLGLQFTIDYLLYNKGRNTERTQAKDVTQSGDLQTTINQLEQKTLSEHNAEESEELENEDEEEKTNETSKGADEKPGQSYIALISMAILDSDEKKLLLCDIYQWIMDHYPYFKSKDKNWRNSVRHNLSLNECFIKAGRSDNGKGHFWAIHPANLQDFANGDYHRRRARRRIRRVTGQLPFTIPTHIQSFCQVKRTPCWCCPPSQPLMCYPPRVYWNWAALQTQQTPAIHGLI
ncbi:hypothetical protein DNTS_025845 [Danionella cerebrum]|uniref:Fork-head domain-containing protein n=1 Tax=Danionella cerebrum TaxID=2873325 RepID=A0A553NA60_9TELE|nr:hypothetical protein DNTS_025845 [Danionella translucida]